MQYIIKSGFVSFASSLNIAILAVMTVAAIVPDIWILHRITSLFGILFNCYVLLYSKRKLRFLSEALRKFQRSTVAFKQTFMKLKVETEDYINTTVKRAVLEFLDQQPSMEFLTSYLDPTRTKKSISQTTLFVNNKVVKECTPETSSLVTKPLKSQSDPLSRTKLSIKGKYLPVGSPELFKNKIYLTRRNLANALHD